MLTQKLESSVESSYVNKLKNSLVYKISTGKRGFPDRMILHKIPKKHQHIVNKYVSFVEMKALGGKLSIHQKERFKELQNFGYTPKVYKEQK